MDDAFERFFFCLAVVVTLFTAYCIVRVTMADGRVTYCYVTQTAPQGMPLMYQAWGHRDWRPDQQLTTRQTFEEVVRDVSTLNCPVSVKP